MSDVFLSLACICGDSGVKTLPRTLKSVIERPEGPLVDEIVIAWNGENDAAFIEGLSNFDPCAFRLPAIGAVGDGLVAAVPLRIIRQQWQNDFSAARNESLKHAHGDWILWIDTDDHVSSAADLDSLDGLKAINAAERAFNLPLTPAGPSSGSTLKSWLKQLPWNITCVRAPYDYAIDAHGNAIIRQMRRRILRRDCYLWRLPIHELAYPAPGLVESAVDTLGLLIRHYPGEESAARMTRNKTVLDAMQERMGSSSDTSQPIDFADARHAYDVAAMNISLGDLTAADSAIRVAIQRSGDRLDTYRYRLTRAQINIQRGMYEAAYAEAVAATGLKPEMQDAWFVASECQYLLGQWQSCIAFYEMGEGKKPVPQPVDFVIARETKPRAQVAIAYCEIGEPEKGLKYAEEAVKLYPADGMCCKTYERVNGDARKKRAVDGVLTAIELLIAKREMKAANEMLAAACSNISLRGITWLPRCYEARAAVNASLKRHTRIRAVGDPLPAELLVQEHDDFHDARTVYYDTATGPPEDTESLVSYWCAKGYQTLQVAAVDGGVVARVRPTVKQPLTFYSPHAITQWDPYFPEKFGVGGSESAVVYLARELARRGYPITVYCPTGTHVGCDMGFVWRSLGAFDMRADHGVLIACRAPWVLRNPDLRSPTFVWHQDNGYGSTWFWNKEIDKLSAGSLHVSDWARAGLLRELGAGDSARHHVIGNGVCAEWCLVSKIPSPSAGIATDRTVAPVLPERNPHRVIYASDPTRGLDTLLNCWPHVVEAIPDAELHVYGEMTTANMLLAGTMATARELNFLQMREKLHKQKSVTYKGRVGQVELSSALMAAGVYAYPGGMMPEGYGIALAQAAAAGCAVVFPNEGALPDIHDRSYMVPPVKDEAAAKVFLDTLINAVRNADSRVDRRAISQRMLDSHSWSKVADRFVVALDNLLQTYVAT